MVESFKQGATLVKLVLRNKEYEVKPGMNLLAALQKINVIPESVIATRDGEMILDDEILKDGDVVKLVAVISGGSILDIRLSDNEYRQ
jgi:sulfur carrier protein ThiS